MLDIQFIRDNPELVKQKSKDKGYDIDIDELLRRDESRRSMLSEIETFKHQRNEIADAAQGKKPSDEQIEQGKKVKQEIAQREDTLKQTEESFYELLRTVPNITFNDVPVGGEEDSVEIKQWGEQTSGAEDHLDYAAARDWVDFERGTKVAGTKFYYLKGDLALLENAITQFALDFVLKKGFTYLTVPHLVNSRTALGAGFAPKGSDEGNEYFVENEDLTLIGTAEAPLTGYHADEIIDEAELPKLYVGYSPCYRREAGTYGKHSRGLFRVHQFNKLEMYAFTTPEQSLEMHERILAIEEEIWQAIGIPYHVINIASADLGAPAAKKYDLEYWSPVDGAYRELTSCSNCTDFQARNLNIRVRRKSGDVETLHTLNGTAVSLARSLVAIIEHCQSPDGKLNIPTVLQPYMQGRSQI
jgi:seryl-tRNA synthetase